MAATFLVTSPASLKRVIWLQRASRVLISSPRLAQMDRKRLQERMNLLLGVSGYGLGLTALVTGLVLCILWTGGHWKFFEAHWLSTCGLGAMACLFAGGVGRAIGFLYARWRLARLIWTTLAEKDDFSGMNCGIGTRRTALLTRKTMAQ